MHSSSPYLRASSKACIPYSANETSQPPVKGGEGGKGRVLRVFGPSLGPHSPNLVECEFSEVGGLSSLSDYGDRAMGVADHRIRDTAQQSPP
jgi:hypothetical protein